MKEHTLKSTAVINGIYYSEVWCGKRIPVYGEDTRLRLMREYLPDLKNNLDHCSCCDAAIITAIRMRMKGI